MWTVSCITQTFLSPWQINLKKEDALWLCTGGSIQGFLAMCTQQSVMAEACGEDVSWPPGRWEQKVGARPHQKFPEPTAQGQAFGARSWRGDVCIWTITSQLGKKRWRCGKLKSHRTNQSRKSLLLWGEEAKPLVGIKTRDRAPTAKEVAGWHIGRSFQNPKRPCCTAPH